MREIFEQALESASQGQYGTAEAKHEGKHQRCRDGHQRLYLDIEKSIGTGHRATCSGNIGVGLYKRRKCEIGSHICKRAGAERHQI